MYNLGMKNNSSVFKDILTAPSGRRSSHFLSFEKAVENAVL